MDDDRYTRITLRLPKDLHSLLDAESSRTSKSMNAEIIARLHASFTDGIPALPQVLLDEIDLIAEKKGISNARALEEVLLKGLANKATKVLFMNVGPGATMADMKAGIAEAEQHADADSPVFLQRHR